MWACVLASQSVGHHTIRNQLDFCSLPIVWTVNLTYDENVRLRVCAPDVRIRVFPVSWNNKVERSLKMQTKQLSMSRQTASSVPHSFHVFFSSSCVCYDLFFFSFVSIEYSFWCNSFAKSSVSALCYYFHYFQLTGARKQHRHTQMRAWKEKNMWWNWKRYERENPHTCIQTKEQESIHEWMNTFHTKIIIIIFVSSICSDFPPISHFGMIQSPMTMRAMSRHPIAHNTIRTHTGYFVIKKNNAIRRIGEIDDASDHRHHKTMHRTGMMLNCTYLVFA